MTSLGRARRIAPDARRVFVVLVDGVLESGAPPGPAALAARLNMPSEQVDLLLQDLVRADWVARDDEGQLSAVYPFAMAPTGIDVALGEPRRPVMCATDALGAAPLLGRPLVAHATCVQCQRAIAIHLKPDGIARRRPRSVVVVRRLTAGPAHATRCAATRFACSPAHAAEWIALRGGPDDVIRSLETAFIEARELFGNAYLP